MIVLPVTAQRFCATWSTAKPLTLGRRLLRSRLWPMAYGSNV
jgi:hypothetical protein